MDIVNNVEEEQPDTLPGFKMQSENFVLKFVTGLQKGVCSKLLEYETDWYDMMEIILSRLEDEPVNQANFQVTKSSFIVFVFALCLLSSLYNLAITGDCIEGLGKLGAHPTRG